MIDVEVVVHVAEIRPRRLVLNRVRPAVHVGEQRFHAELFAEELLRPGEHVALRLGQKRNDVAAARGILVWIHRERDRAGSGIALDGHAPGIFDCLPATVTGGQEMVPRDLPIAGHPLVQAAQVVARVALVDHRQPGNGGILGVGQSGVGIDVREQVAGEGLPVLERPLVHGHQHLEAVHAEVALGALPYLAGEDRAGDEQVGRHVDAALLQRRQQVVELIELIGAKGRAGAL